MNLIVAVDKNWAIGCNNRLLVSIPSDMKFFRETTMGKVVVMGRQTLESFPGGQPLKNRTNIVITSDSDYKVKDAIVVPSIEAAVGELKKYEEEDICKIRKNRKKRIKQKIKQSVLLNFSIHRIIMDENSKLFAGDGGKENGKSRYGLEKHWIYVQTDGTKIRF